MPRDLSPTQLRRRAVIWGTFPLSIVFVALAVFISAWFALPAVATEIVFGVCLWRFVKTLLAEFEAERQNDAS